jgi:hypothetical protein
VGGIVIKFILETVNIWKCKLSHKSFLLLSEHEDISSGVSELMSEIVGMEALGDALLKILAQVFSQLLVSFSQVECLWSI